MNIEKILSNPSPNILPDCRAKKPTGVIRIENVLGSLNWIKIFCASCGADGGMVPEEHCTFAFYLCDPCADKWQPLSGTWIEPDAVFFQKVKDAMIEKYGRELTSEEIINYLSDPNHFLNKLANDRAANLRGAK